MSGRVSGNSRVSEKVSGTFCDFVKQISNVKKVFQIVFVSVLDVSQKRTSAPVRHV